MKQNCLLALFIAVVMISCGSNEDNKTIKKSSNDKYKNIKDEVIVFDSVAPVKIMYPDSIIGWKGYFQVKENLQDFKRNTPHEVMTMAEGLVANIELMKDSITVKTLDDKGIRSRINVLLNQALRLQDMKNIPAITVPEVVKQTQGLFTVYRMINHKINAIYQQNDFENELIEEDFFFSKLDSIE